MRDEVIRKKVHRSSKKNKIAREEQGFSGVDYFCDYSPRYQETYNIYEKAKIHARQRKNEERLKNRETIRAKTEEKIVAKKDEKSC